jgi:hypothetical protein
MVVIWPPVVFCDCFQFSEPLHDVADLDGLQAQFQNRFRGAHARRLVFGLAQDLAEGFHGLRSGLLQLRHSAGPDIGKVSRGRWLVDYVLCLHAAYRTQLFCYLKACGREELNIMNLWAGVDGKM